MTRALLLGEGACVACYVTNLPVKWGLILTAIATLFGYQPGNSRPETGQTGDDEQW